jgi:hypothetical protein
MALGLTRPLIEMSTSNVSINKRLGSLNTTLYFDIIKKERQLKIQPDDGHVPKHVVDLFILTLIPHNKDV